MCGQTYPHTQTNICKHTNAHIQMQEQYMHTQAHTRTQETQMHTETNMPSLPNGQAPSQWEILFQKQG